jgi:hypothetical protein
LGGEEMKYQIVCADDVDKLAERVEERLQDEWMLQGGVAVWISMNGPRFYQAMKKYEDTDD